VVLKNLTGISLCLRREISYNLRTNFLYIIYVGLRRLCHDSGHQWRTSHHGSPLSISITMYVVEKVILGHGFCANFSVFFWQFHSATAPYLHFIFLPPTSCSLKNLQRLKTTGMNSGSRGKLCSCEFFLLYVLILQIEVPNTGKTGRGGNVEIT
jgi:hypothetical protein